MINIVCKYNGNEYRVLQYVSLKHPTSHQWVPAVLYTDKERTYVRELSDFENKFQEVSSTAELRTVRRMLDCIAGFCEHADDGPCELCDCSTQMSLDAKKAGAILDKILPGAGI